MQPDPSRLSRFWLRLLRDREGATAIEYGLFIGIFSIVLIVGMQQFGGALVGTYNVINNSIQNAQP